MARSGIIYGDSNTGKSTAAKHFSHYIYERTGKCTLLLSMDGGGWGPMQPEIDAGVISAYRCNTEIPLPTLQYISKGYFPADTNETEATRNNLTRIDWNKFGGFIVEGVTSISEAIMRHLADKQIKTGEDATSPFHQRVLVEGRVETVTFAGNSKAHFGFAQKSLYSLIMNFIGLPCDYVLFTGLESRSEDDDRTPIYGPQIAGKKASSKIPSWVGQCIHAQDFPVSVTVQVPDPADPKKLVDSTVFKNMTRMYYEKHPDPVTNIMYPANSRVIPEKYEELQKAYPGGFFVPGLTEGFDKFLHTLDALIGSQVNAVGEWRRKVDARFRAAREQAAAGAGTATGVTALAGNGHAATTPVTTTATTTTATATK